MKKIKPDPKDPVYVAMKKITPDSEDPIYEALKAEPPTELGPTQKYVPRGVGGDLGPKGQRKLDRNGNPTEELVFNANKPFEITAKRLGHIRGLIERDVRKESAEAIRTLQHQLDLARSDRDALRAERDDLAATARVYDRAGREDKIQARIREACEAHTATLQDQIKGLRAEISRLTSENGELREAKRRLKAARQGAR